MKNILLIILFISLLYLIYLYFNKYKMHSESKPILKNNAKKQYSDNNFDLTENALNQLNNVFNEYIQSKQKLSVF
jgi:hypothetical protein